MIRSSDLGVFGHIPADLDPGPPPSADAARFVATIGQIRRTSNGGALVVLAVEPEWIADVFTIWNAESLVSVNIEKWRPSHDD